MMKLPDGQACRFACPEGNGDAQRPAKTRCARRSSCQSAFGRGFNSPHLHQHRENQQSIVIAGFSLFINALRCFRKSLRCEKRCGFTIIFRIMQTYFANKMLTKMLTACFKLKSKITVIGKAPTDTRRGCMCCAVLTSFPSCGGLHP